MERFLDFQFEKEVKLLPLFLSESFRAVAVSLLSLFSAVYIYKSLFALTNQQNLGLFGAFAFFLGVYGFKFLSNLFTEELSLKLGLKKQVYFGLFFLGLSLISLALSVRWLWLLFWAAPLCGLATGFYWFGRHGLIVKIGRNGAYGKELGMVEGIKTLFLLAIPLIGGLLISLAGYAALFWVSLFFIFLAILAIGPVREKRTHYDTSLAEVWQLFKTHKRMALAYMGHSAGKTVYVVAIPLYLFLVLKKELALGEFFSLSMISVALISLFIGRWIDLKGKKASVAYGSILNFFIWVGRIFTQSIAVLFIFDIIERITGSMTGIPLEVLSYQKALSGGSTGRALLFRELAITSGAILSCCLLVLLTILGVRFQFCFFLAALFSLSPLLIVKKSR